MEWNFVDRRFFRKDNSMHKKSLLPRQQCQSQIPFKDFIICTLITSVNEIHQLFLWEVIEGRKSRHLSNLKVIFLLPDLEKVRVVILNERSLEPRMLPWQPKFCQDQTFFLYNFLFLEFQWIRFSNYRVIVNLITQWLTCKPDDVIIFTVVVVCSEPILSVMFRPFKHRYLWNQIRYQKTVNSVHSCFSCTFIWENKNFCFISTLILGLLHSPVLNASASISVVLVSYFFPC